MPTPVRVGALEDLITTLPYLLGYPPENSLAVVGMHGERLGAVARLDRLGGDARYDPRLVDALAERFRDHGAAILVAFDDDPSSRRRGLRQVGKQLERRGVDVLDRLVVSEGRWWSSECVDPHCCPPGGRPLPRPQDVPAVAALVLRGKAVAPSREALAASVRARPLDSRMSLAPHPASPVRGAALTAAWTRALGFVQSPLAPGEIAVEDASAIVASLRDVELRDELLGLLCPGMVPPSPRRRLSTLQDCVPAGPEAGAGASGDLDDPWGEALHRLVRLSTVLPDEHRGDVLAVCAAGVWWRGDGTLAGLLLDEALAADPAHRLGSLLSALLASGVRPTELMVGARPGR